jgi:hypothetical protein
LLLEIFRKLEFHSRYSAHRHDVVDGSESFSGRLPL